MCLCLADNMFKLMHKSAKLWVWASLSIVFTLLVTVLTQQITTPLNTSWDCQQLDFCSDKLGFEAIEWLFRQLDDDANGNVDITESNEFLRDELKYENGYERQKAFHGNDKQITVDELWKAWKASAVRNWTVDETVDWLINTVELPQYVEQFQHNAVDGMALPRLAANTQFISILGINNPIHKQKLAVKAMDVVLFGAPKTHNFVKDVILAVSLIIAIGGVWFAYVQHKSSQSHLKKMLKDMDTLQKAEEQLSGLQQELDKIREEQQIVFEEKSNLEKKLTERTASYSGLTDVARIAELEDELDRLRNELKRSQTSHSSRWSAPHNLQLWLQLTHELEIRSYNSKRMSAESQLYAAKEGCERLRKKRATLLGAFRVAHGNSIDDVDNRILQAKTALSEVTKDLQERLHRWRQIEMYCGFQIIQNPGHEYLQTVLYGSPVGGLPQLGLSRVGSESSIDEEGRGKSGSLANVSIAGFGLQMPSDKTSLLSLNNNNNINRKHSNGTVFSNNSTIGEQSGDEFEEIDDVVSQSSIKVNPSFSIGNSSLRDSLKSFESKAHNRSKMMQKSFSEDQDSARLRYERQDTIEADSLCHSESCTELEACASLASIQRSPESDSPESKTIISDKMSSSAAQTHKSMDELNASNDSNSLKDFENSTKIAAEKKRSFLGLRKRKLPKQP